MKLRLVVTSWIVLACVACENRGTLNSGINIAESTSAIIDGVEVLPADPLAKHTVLINIYQKANEEAPMPKSVAKCTGVIVAEKSVLTAAHCFKGIEANKVTYLEVYFTTTGDKSRKTPMVYGVEYSRHKFYTEQNPQNFDLAMITLGDTIPENYAPVPLLPYNVELKKGDTVFPVGFGQTQDKDDSVNQRLNKSKGVKITSDWGTFFQVDQSAGQGVCNGDSGGPTFYNLNGKWYLAGITFGNVVAKKVEGQRITCFDEAALVKVQTHRTWITENIAE